MTDPVPPPPPPTSPPPPPPPGTGGSAPRPPFAPVVYGGESNAGTNGLAIASMVLGILWLCGLGSLLAVIFGLVALNQIKKSADKGKGFAIAGLVLGGLGLLVTVVGTLALVVAADEVTSTRSDERDDVEITSCVVGDSGRAVVTIDVTNDSSKPSTYLITLEVRDRESSAFESLGTAIGELAPDDTTTDTLRTESDGFSDPRCRVDYVQRFAAD